jgi:hypothetical protein
MDLQGALYKVAAVAWIGLVIWAGLAVGDGAAEPWLTISDFPGGSYGALIAAIGVAFAGLLVLRFIQERHEAKQWEAAGRQAGLSPVGDGSSDGALELTGSIDGRPVTVRYVYRREKQGNEGRHQSVRSDGDTSTHRVTYTIVEAELSGAADGGVIASPASRGGGSGGGSGMLGIDDTSETDSGAEGVFAVAEDGLFLKGTPPAAVEAVSEGQSGRALRAIRDFQIAAVGDASGVAARLTEEAGGSMFGVGMGDAILKDIPSDETMVYVETMASIRDGDELRRFAEGAVAVADAFEEATARTSAPE